MSQNPQILDRDDKKLDLINGQPDASPVGKGMGNGLSKAAIGAVVGAFVGTLAGALANKKTAHSINSAVKNVGDAVKGAAQGINNAVKGSPDVVKGTNEGVANGVNNAVKGAAEEVKHTVEDAKPSERQSFKLYEERLVADKKQVKTAEISIAKHVETQTAHISVPVKKERLVVEQITPIDVGMPAAPGEANFHQGEIARVEVYEETADVHKQAFVREEVSIRKEVEHNTVEIEDTIRREELDVGFQDGTGIDKDKMATKV